MKKIGFVLMFVLMISNVLALNISVEDQNAPDQHIITEFQNPVSYNLKVTNNGDSEKINFYTLLAFDIQPSEKIQINSKETKNINLTVTPLNEFKEQGAYTITYFINNQNNDQIQKKLVVFGSNLENSFSIGATKIDPETQSLNIFIKNKVNYNFTNINAEFNSPFFEFTKDFDLNAYEKKEFQVSLNKEQFNKLTAGFYTLKANLEINDSKASIEDVIEFKEKDIIETIQKDSGIIINKKIITRTNQGNTISKATITLEKNIISRLFTSFHPTPDVINRQGFIVYYTWNKNIMPSESLEIIVTTNWLIPLLIIALIILIVVLSKQYIGDNLILRKKVSFVKVKKGGEFGLKVTIFVKAKKHLENINITDKLPPLVDIYERFGAEQPSRIDNTKRKIEWDFESLEQGETRILSYIIYSKLGVVGRFALPATTAIYEKEGEIKESQSNRAYFVAEHKQEE